MIKTKYSKNVAEALLATALFAVIDVAVMLLGKFFPGATPDTMAMPALMVLVGVIIGSTVALVKGINKIATFNSARFEPGGFLVFILTGIAISIGYEFIFSQKEFPAVADIGIHIIMSLYMFDILYGKLLKRDDSYYNKRA